MLSKSPLEEFRPKFEIVSCFVQAPDATGQEQILLLLRQDHKPQPNTWGIPAGKQDPGEVKEEAMLRELSEETGMALSSQDVVLVDTAYVRFPELDFVQHIFAVRLPAQPTVIINPEEHKDFCWIASDHATSLDLIQDLDACIDILHQSQSA